MNFFGTRINLKCYQDRLVAVTILLLKMLVGALLFRSVSLVQPFSALSSARLLSRSLNQPCVMTDTYFSRGGWRRGVALRLALSTRILLMVKLPWVISFPTSLCKDLASLRLLDLKTWLLVTVLAY